MDREHLSDPFERLVVEMLASSAAILRSAIRNGYIDENLSWEPAGHRLRFGGHIKGFQLGLIRSADDIQSEIDFFRSGHAAAWMTFLGAKDMDAEDSILRLTGR